MRKAIVLDPDDIKNILAEKYDVPVKNVIKSQYSYTVIVDKSSEDLPEQPEML